MKKLFFIAAFVASAASCHGLPPLLETLLEPFLSSKTSPSAAQQVLIPLEQQQLVRFKKILNLDGIWTSAHTEYYLKQLVIYGVPMALAAYLNTRECLDEDPMTLQATLVQDCYNNRHTIRLALPVATVATIIALRNLRFFCARLRHERANVVLEHIAAHWKKYQQQIPSQFHPVFKELAQQYTRLGNRLELTKNQAQLIVSTMMADVEKQLAQHQATTTPHQIINIHEIA